VALDPTYEKIAGPLGHLIIEFNALELAVASLVARLLSQDENVAAAFLTISFSARLTIARQITDIKVLDLEHRSAIETELQNAQGVNAERNAYIHSEYLGVGGASPDVLRGKHRDRVAAFLAPDSAETHTFYPTVRVDHIIAQADKAHNTAQNIRALAERYHDRNP
jgi:hypothetical protein